MLNAARRGAKSWCLVFDNAIDGARLCAAFCHEMKAISEEEGEECDQLAFWQKHRAFHWMEDHDGDSVVCIVQRVLTVLSQPVSN